MFALETLFNNIDWSTYSLNLRLHHSLLLFKTAEVL